MDPNSAKHCINYQVLFGLQGITLTPAEVQETKISISRALQVAAKCMVLKSITKSLRIIGKNAVDKVSGTSTIPEMKTLAEKAGCNSET